MNQQQTGIALKPYSTTELAKIYSVSNKTFLRWIKPFSEAIGPKNGRYFSIPQVRIIFEKLELPSIIKDE